MQKTRKNQTYLKLICFKTLWLCSIFRCCVMAVVTEVDLFYVSICSGHVAQGLWRSTIYILFLLPVFAYNVALLENCSRNSSTGWEPKPKNELTWHPLFARKIRKDLPCSTSCEGESPRWRVRMFLPGDCAASWFTLLAFPSSQRQRWQRFIARQIRRFEPLWPVKISTILQWNLDVLDIVKARRLAPDWETT